LQTATFGGAAVFYRACRLGNKMSLKLLLHLLLLWQLHWLLLLLAVQTQLLPPLLPVPDAARIAERLKNQVGSCFMLSKNVSNKDGGEDDLFRKFCGLID
jgi:hypothetical protein